MTWIFSECHHEFESAGLFTIYAFGQNLLFTLLDCGNWSRAIVLNFANQTAVGWYNFQLPRFWRFYCCLKSSLSLALSGTLWIYGWTSNTYFAFCKLNVGWKFLFSGNISFAEKRNQYIKMSLLYFRHKEKSARQEVNYIGSNVLSFYKISTFAKHFFSTELQQILIFLPFAPSLRVSGKLKFVSNISFLYQNNVRKFIMLFPLFRLPSYQVTHQSLLHFVHWISETQFIWNFCYCLTDPTRVSNMTFWPVHQSDDHLVSFKTFSSFLEIVLYLKAFFLFGNSPLGILIKVQVLWAPWLLHFYYLQTTKSKNSDSQKEQISFTCEN